MGHVSHPFIRWLMYAQHGMAWQKTHVQGQSNVLAAIPCLQRVTAQ